MPEQLTSTTTCRVDPDVAMRSLRARPAAVVCDDPEAQTVQMLVAVGGTQVARRAVVTLDAEPASADDGALVRLAVTWCDMVQPARYPTVSGVLALRRIEARPRESELSLDVEHEAPGGIAGRLVDRTAGRRLAQHSIDELLTRIADRLLDRVALDVAEDARHVAERQLSWQRLQLLDP